MYGFKLVAAYSYAYQWVEIRALAHEAFQAPQLRVKQ